MGLVFLSLGRFNRTGVALIVCSTATQECRGVFEGARCTSNLLQWRLMMCRMAGVCVAGDDDNNSSNKVYQA